MSEDQTPAPLPFVVVQPVPLVTPQRATTICAAVLALRCIAGDQAARMQRDPSCFLPTLADVLEAIADGDLDVARNEMRRWAAVARTLDGGAR
jgi:hypothetical protein